MSIALTTNKVAAAAVGVAMVFAFAFVTPARAQSVEDLTAQIASLLATITALQAQLAGMTGGTVVTTGSYNFTENHSQGDRGGEVMDIQKFLNANGFPVASTGAGSPGNETSYFGSLTKTAVTAWQNANAVSVLTPVGLSAGTGYWGPSSRAYANSLGGSVVTPGPAPVPTGTGITVSATTQPSNGLAVANAANVPFTKFTVTNNSGSVQTVNSVTIERGGLLDDAAFSSVVLLDQDGTQLGNTKVLNSAHQANVGSAVALAAGESRTFTVAGNMGSSLGSYAGQVGSLSVVAINTTATVTGSLPITGASHTINSNLLIGSATAASGVEDPGASATKEIGTNGYTFSAVKLTAGSAEDLRFQSIRFDQSGSASSSDIANVMGYVDGVAYTPVIDGDTYTFNFGSGIIIKKGLSKEVVIKGDIVGGTNRTVAFDVYKYTDINVSGETYGYGITASQGSGFSSTSPVFNASVVTISAGTFNSVSKSSAAPAANIATLTSDELLGAFTIDIKGEGITVQTVTVTGAIGQNGGTPVGTDLDSVTLVDQNGSIVAGPVDATGSGTTATATFSGVSFSTGSTTLYVKGYLASNFTATDTIAMTMDPTAWSGATGDVTGDTVDLSSMAAATGNTMTVQAAALKVTTLTQPAARSIVSGTTDFVFATADVDAANSGEDVRVTSLTVTDTSATGLGTEFNNVEIWANLTGGSTADSVRGDVYETIVKSAEQMAGSTGANTLVMNLDTALVVPKNTAIGVAVVGDISSAASANDTHTVKISAATAVGTNSGSGITETFAGSGQLMTIAASGTLTLTVDSSTPVAGIILDDTVTEQTSVVFRLAADNVEDLDVDSIKITSDGADDAVAKYVFYNGSTKLGEKTGGQDTAELFLADGALTVPADGYVLVTVKVIMNNIDGTQIVNADTVVTTIAAAGDVDTTGKDSGVAVDSSGTAYDGNTLTMYEAYPTVAIDSTGVTSALVASANTLVGRIVITNAGDKDITFTTTDSDQIVANFTIAGSVSTTTNAVVLKEDSTGNTLSTGDLAAVTGATTGTFSTWTNQLTVPANSSKTLSVIVATTGLTTSNDSIQMWLDDSSANNLEFAIDSTGAYAVGDVVFRGDIYGTAMITP